MMQIKINDEDIKALKKLNNQEINKYLDKIDNINEDEAIEFMEYIYDKSNEYLQGKNYDETPESKLLEKIADYIYEKTN